MGSPKIVFNKPYMTGKELQNIVEAHSNFCLAGDGPFTKKCHAWLENYADGMKALLTHSCTAALEMSALLLDIRPGDEVIMPSYTFVSTANAFVLRDATPVFVDIRPDTLNLDEALLEEAITPQTRAIVPVHYAGVGCEMDTVMSIANRYGLRVVEDAAQGMMAKYKGRPLGSFGDLAAYSFHESKNVISGEGGALLLKDETLFMQAEIIREKGTDRSRFFRGHVDKYTWREVGSSYLPGELTAAFLSAQLDYADYITQQRLALWDRYHTLLEPLETCGYLRRPNAPTHCQHNAHMYYVVLGDNFDRGNVLRALNERGVGAVFHYVPLHSSPAGVRYGRASGPLLKTSSIAQQLIRLPLWLGLSESQQCYVVENLIEILGASTVLDCSA